MKNNFGSRHRISSISKTDNRRQVDQQSTDANTKGNEKSAGTSSTAAKKISPLRADIFSIRVKADEDRPE